MREKINMNFLLDFSFEAALDVLQHLTFCKILFRICVYLTCVTVVLSQTL